MELDMSKWIEKKEDFGFAIVKVHQCPNCLEEFGFGKNVPTTCPICGKELKK